MFTKIRLSTFRITNSRKSHLKADGAAVAEIASGGVKLAHGAHLEVKTFKPASVNMQIRQFEMRWSKGTVWVKRLT